MKRIYLLCFLAFLLPGVPSAKELPKIAVWDLTSGDIKPGYAQDLTLIVVSEVAKLGSYEVYSQENVRTLAGWTEERLKLGCSSTQCLVALGQMDIAKLISGRVGKIGNTYSVSLILFDTQNTKSEKAVSEFGRSEDDLIPLVQTAVRKLLGAEAVSARAEMKAPEKGSGGGGEERTDFSKLPLDRALILGPKEAPLKMAVFTDPDCPYCGKFHGEMEKIVRERKDIVFYIFLFPLPMHKDAYWKSKSIVCENSLKMLADAFEQRPIPRRECPTRAIDENIALARTLGIRGTPTTIFPDGRIKPGSVTAQQLLDSLQNIR